MLLRAIFCSGVMRLGPELLRVAAVRAAEMLVLSVTFSNKVRTPALETLDITPLLTSTSAATSVSSASSSAASAASAVRTHEVDVGPVNLLVLGGQPALGLPSDFSDLLEVEFVSWNFQQLVLDWFRVS